MRTAAELIRLARTDAGLTQAQLASRLGTTQSAIARLEQVGSNPTVDTLRQALRAADHRLDLDAEAQPRNIDETLTAERLKLTPEERLESFEAWYASTRELVGRARRVA